MSFLLGTSACFFRRIYSLVTRELLLIALFFLVAVWIIAVLLRKLNPRLGCFGFFSRVFGVVFHGCTTDHRAQPLGNPPQTPLKTSSTLVIGTVAEFQNYLLFNPSFWVSAIIMLLLFLILSFLFESSWLDIFACVCGMHGIALVLVSAVFAENGFAFGNYFFL